MLIYQGAKPAYRAGMDIKETRMTNLQVLIQEAGNAAELCRRCSADPTYLSQLVTGVITPAGTTRGVGDKLARKLEIGMAKPRGWMDVLHVPGLDPEALRLAEAIQSLPPESRAHLQAVTRAFTESQAWDGKLERRKK